MTARSSHHARKLASLGLSGALVAALVMSGVIGRVDAQVSIGGGTRQDSDAPILFRADEIE